MSKIIINPQKKGGKINRNVYGHFSEHIGRGIYNGLFVDEKSDIPNINGMRSDVVDALKHIRVPVLRWPGGCFADEYHWKDGIGPKENRKRMGNENWGCGGNMRPEYYADEYQRFQTYVRNYGENKIFKIACGANVDDYNWTDTVVNNPPPNISEQKLSDI